MKKLFTLLAGYAAGLAIAMKVRKDAGTSKLDSADPKKSTFDKLFDEVKDIHTSTYADIKKGLSTHFADVETFDDLKKKASGYIDTLSDEVNTLMEKMTDASLEKKQQIADQIESLFDRKDALLEEAKAKGSTLADTTADTITSWIESLRSKLSEKHEEVSETLEKAKVRTRRSAKKTKGKVESSAL